MTSLSYQEFALFAYSGAMIWVATFLSIGYFFGSYWLSFFGSIEIDIDDIITAGIFIGLAYLVYLTRKKRSKI
jgi:membrane protein DedA with SNARE-associated domain